jgi:osmoprotectant transport system ATP-binding protein
MPAAIEFRSLSFKTVQGRLLLVDISLSVEEGTVTAILGRSGSGKTTLMRTANRMVEPTSGAVLVKGDDVRQADLISLRRGMGYVIQEN